jgi:streptomycin 6-kinase
MFPVCDLPPVFVRNVTGAFAGGAEWLQSLPVLLATCFRRWDLTSSGRPFDLSFHYVVPVLRSGKYPAVLKLGVPSPGLISETKALSMYRGRGATALLESDPALGALLLEHIRPGNTLAACEDPIQACEFAAQVMQKLWQASAGEAEFRSLESWTSGMAKLRERFDGGTGPLDSGMVDAAEHLRAELLQDKSASVLLHGDLHHDNILYSDRVGWVAIDPKGVIGDPCYEPASFLLNPNPDVVLNLPTQKSRIAVLAEHLNLEPRRIARWAFVHAVLSAWWTIEDGGEDWSTAISASRLLLVQASDRL